jgi:hypothetical protein
MPGLAPGSSYNVRSTMRNCQCKPCTVTLNTFYMYSSYRLVTALKSRLFGTRLGCGALSVRDMIMVLRGIFVS